VLPTDGIVAVILAAGQGTRLRPLTALRPKALCPIGNVAALDLAFERLAELGFRGPQQVAVNAWYCADQLVAAVAGQARVAVEATPAPLGTAGGVANLRDFIAGRGVLVANVDAYLAGASLHPLLAGWDGREVRLLGTPTTRDDPQRFGAHRFAGLSLLPWSRVARLAVQPSDLVHEVWRPAQRAGELRVVEYPGRYLDIGTPADYLAANLDRADEFGEDGCLVAGTAVVTGEVRRSVIGSAAHVDGRLDRCVVWPGAQVRADEQLTAVIRYASTGTVAGG
jgi:NDP-sugar pyrophosphorylase family protein